MSRFSKLMVTVLVSALAIGLAGPVGQATAGLVGNVYVANFGSDAIAAFDLDGNFLANFTSPDLDGAVPFDVGPDGLIYAGGYMSQKVVRFNKYGSQIGSAISLGFNPAASAFDSSGNLLVVDFKSGAAGVGEVRRFDPLTGAPLDAGAFISGLYLPTNIIAHDGKIYVNNRPAGTINVHDETTGAYLATFGGGVLGTDSGQGPEGMVFGPDIGGSGGSATPDGAPDLYVADRVNNRVVAFSVTDGSVINANYVPASLGPENLNSPFTPRFLPGGDLVISESIAGAGKVKRFDGSSVVQFGQAASVPPASLNSPNGMAVTTQIVPEPFPFGGAVFVGSYRMNAVLKFDEDGNYADTFTSPAFNGVAGVAMGPDDLLYVASWDGTVAVLDHDGNHAGATFSVAATAIGATFDSSGNLVVTNFSAGQINRYDPTTGTNIDGGPFVTGLGHPDGPMIGDGKIFVGSRDQAAVLVFDETTGAPLGSIGSGVLGGGPGQLGPEGIVLGPDFNGDGIDDVYVADRPNNRVAVFSGDDWSVLDADFLTGFLHPIGLAVMPDGNLLIGNNADTNPSLSAILLFDGYSLTQLGDAGAGAPAFLQGPGEFVIARYVPEPSTFVLLTVGLLGLAVFHWRRK